MKKFFKSLIGIAGALTIALTLFACTGTGNNAGTSEVITEEEDIVAFSALSATQLLSSGSGMSGVSMDGGVSISPMALIKTAEEDETTEEDDVLSEIDEINKYMNIFESFLQESPLKVTELVSDKPEYAYEVMITTKDISGNTSQYLLYYNVTVTAGAPEESQEPEVSGEPENTADTGLMSLVEESAEPEVSEEPEISQEPEISEEPASDADLTVDFTGIMIYNDTEYAVTGRAVTENGETRTSFISKIDEKNFVKITTAVEEGVQKFKYEVKVDGKITSKTEVRICTEENQTKITLKFVEGGNRGEYTFKKAVEDNMTIIKIQSKIDGINLNMKVFIITNQDGTTSYVYKFESGNEHKEGREDKRDFHKRGGYENGDYGKNREIPEDDDDNEGKFDWERPERHQKD